MQGVFARFERAFVGAIFYLHTHRAVVTGVAEDRKEPAPIDIAQAGQLRRVVFIGRRQDAHLVEPVVVEPNVFGVDVKEAVGEVAHGAEVVHLLPHHVGGIVIQPEMIAGDVLEHAPPDSRAVGEVLAAGPFVAGKIHRAVLDTDADTAFFGVADQRLPDLLEARPVFLHRLRPVAADERIHLVDVEQRGGLDHLLDVIDVDLRFVRVGRERVGIIAQAADGHAGCRCRFVDTPGIGLAEACRVEVGDTGVPARGFPLGPAHQLDTVVARFRREGQNVFQREIRKDGTYESQFHIFSAKKIEGGVNAALRHRIVVEAGRGVTRRGGGRGKMLRNGGHFSKEHGKEISASSSIFENSVSGTRGCHGRFRNYLKAPLCHSELVSESPIDGKRPDEILKQVQDDMQRRFPRFLTHNKRLSVWPW